MAEAGQAQRLVSANAWFYPRLEAYGFMGLCEGA